jgi:hypothetical protein
MLRTLSIVETDAGLTYTARASVPAGARLLDVLIESSAAWTAATADLDVGDLDGADALIASADITGTDGSAAEGLGGTDWGFGRDGTNGPYSASGPGKLYPSGSTITAVVTATVPGGPTGISLVTLLLELPGTHRAATVV